MGYHKNFPDDNMKNYSMKWMNDDLFRKLRNAAKF